MLSEAPLLMIHPADRMKMDQHSIRWFAPMYHNGEGIPGGPVEVRETPFAGESVAGAMRYRPATA